MMCDWFRFRFRLKLHEAALSLEPHVSSAAPPAVAVDLVEAVEDARAAVAEEEDGQDDEERRARRRVLGRLRHHFRFVLV